MRVAITIVAVVLIFPIALMLCGWLVMDVPEGHIESATYNADGKVYVATTTSIETLYGTFQKGGMDQSGANTVLASRAIYMALDRNRDGEISSVDEPLGQTSLSAGIDDAVTTIPVQSTAGFLSSGFVRIGTELIKHTGKTATTLTGATRGYNETTAAAHLTAVAVTAVMAWDRVASADVDGSPINATGYDATYQQDDGTEGDILQGETITVKEGCSYLLKLRVIDAAGNTNTEVAAADVFYTHGSNSYCDKDGDAAQGLEDDEVLWIRVNRRVGR